MAQQNTNKKPSKFGMMMNSMGNSAVKSMSRAGKQMGKAAVKAKQTAVTKIAKIPASEEDPEIELAEATLKVMKNEIYALSDIISNLYESRVHETTYLSQLSDRLKQSSKQSPQDSFGVFTQQMGVALSNLEKVQTEHLKRMEDEFVKPLEKFRDSDIEFAQALKLKCRNSKTQFDIANHNLSKAEQSGDQMRIQSAKEKQKTAENALMKVRKSLKVQVSGLVQTKNSALVGSMRQYWNNYGAFCAAQTNIVTNGNGNATLNRNVNTQGSSHRNNTQSNVRPNYNQKAMQSIAQNNEVRNAGQSAMKDKNVRNAAYNVYRTGGNDPNTNAKAMGAIAKNKNVQSAAVSVAKDKNVQRAAWNGAKNNAQSAYNNQRKNQNYGNNRQQNYGNNQQRNNQNNNYGNNAQQNETYNDDNEYVEELDEGPVADYNPFDD